MALDPADAATLLDPTTPQGQIVAVVAIALTVWLVTPPHLGRLALAWFDYTLGARPRIRAAEPEWADLVTVVHLPRVYRASRRQSGIAGDDLVAALVAMSRGTDRTVDTVIAWLLAGEDQRLLLDALGAEITEAELVAHLTGGHRLDPAQVQVLAALHQHRQHRGPHGQSGTTALLSA